MRLFVPFLHYVHFGNGPLSLICTNINEECLTDKDNENCFSSFCILVLCYVLGWM